MGKTLKRLDQECREQKTRMGFCKIEGATRRLLNPIRDAGCGQHAGVSSRAAKLSRQLTSHRNPGAVHAAVRSCALELTHASAR